MSTEVGRDVLGRNVHEAKRPVEPSSLRCCGASSLSYCKTPPPTHGHSEKLSVLEYLKIRLASKAHAAHAKIELMPGSHKASEVLVSDERKQPGMEELAIQIAKGNVDNGRSSVDTKMPPSGPSPEDSEDEKHGNHTVLEVPISDEGKQSIIEGTSTLIGQEIVYNRQSSVQADLHPSGKSPEDSEDEKHENHTHSEITICDEGNHPVIEDTPKQIGQEIPIEQSVEENLNQAGIKMSTDERDLFIKFQNEIGTDVYFSKSPHSLIDGQGSLKATDTFFEHSCPDMKDKWLEYKSRKTYP